MSFYKIFIAFAIGFSIVFFLTSSSSPNLNSIKKESNQIILYDSDQINKIITLNQDNGQIVKIETYVDGKKDHIVKNVELNSYLEKIIRKKVNNLSNKRH